MPFRALAFQFWLKRPELLQVTPLILHDNATPHKAGVVRDVFERYQWEVLKHPPYSPDLSPPPLYSKWRPKFKMATRFYK